MSWLSKKVTLSGAILHEVVVGLQGAIEFGHAPIASPKAHAQSLGEREIQDALQAPSITTQHFGRVCRFAEQGDIRFGLLQRRAELDPEIHPLPDRMIEPQAIEADVVEPVAAAVNQELAQTIVVAIE